MHRIVLIDSRNYSGTQLAFIFTPQFCLQQDDSHEFHDGSLP